jgi:hypothetical protein
MTKVRWVAMGFDKKTERLVHEIELVGLRTHAVMKILGVDDEDEVIGASFDVNPERAKALASYAHGRLDLSIADWQIEARPAKG